MNSVITAAQSADYRNRERAVTNWHTLAPHISSELFSRLSHLVNTSADPDAALAFLTRLCTEKRDDFQRLIRIPQVLLPLVTVFAHSRFLAEEILQQPHWIEELVLSGDLHRHLSAREMEMMLEQFLLRRGPGVPSSLDLAQFRRQQILRILLRDVSGVCNLAETTEELSNLADAILNVTYCHIRDELMKKHGAPRYVDASGNSRECEFSVIALGKLGGRELNYSSDIDLMFLYSANGETDGARSISNKEFFKKVANQLTAVLSTYTCEGLCYRVDLRLRPDGKLGEVCISVEGAEKYYQQRARDWELQMLIKARVAAGDSGPGRRLLEFVEPLIYSSTLDFSAVEAVSATRERIQEKLNQRRGTKELDIKLARGGIRDIEFLVQCLQRLHGGRDPWVRQSGTLHSLFRLRDKNLLSDVEYYRLASAYEFLRHLEHRLQVEDDRQTHTLPQDREALAVLARRMPLAELGGQPSAEKLLAQLQQHLEEVRELYERVIHAQQPVYYQYPATATAVSATAATSTVETVFVEPADSNLVRFLDQRAPQLAATLSRAHLKRGARPLERYLEWIVPNPEWLGWLDSDPILTGYLLDIFEHSPYFSEQMIRFPELLIELKRMREQPGRDASAEEADALEDSNELRRFFRREMFRIQAESICLGTPVFTTLIRTSALADAAIRATYRMAVEQTLLTHPPATARYQAKDQMMVIALGRLGMREFDLASDADLVFVLQDSDAAEHQFWTRVARTIIERLSAYTGEGMMFAVDTRLRPNGREGELVQTERSYKEYFESRAEAWEGITYMKSRAVAGNADRATEFLSELQDVDWRRYGQSGRSQKQLRQMRLRLEREQGAENELKAGRGGFYDIDFALLFLRLKGAGIFYKVLNTPARIDVIEKMGHLERADAAFLRDAASFYRALDHGLRVMMGQAQGSLPKSQAQLEMLTALVARWTPDHLHDQPLEAELAQIRNRTREFFDRLFAA
ncbi:MAG: glutamine-synthetase adenylyltransferase [Bryobacteraceae bacterium]|nr:glutamine-synthetase adenylyltransferase [Bryobacteraceae bacterium]MDW8376725.1 glutamine-synthetase adenylyltransferase [Bryobacterales bacterium]